MKVAVLQMPAEPYKPDANRAATVDLLRAAAAAGARFSILPELSISGYALDRAALAACAEPIDGPTLRVWHQVAAETGMVVAGGLCEAFGDKLYNSAILVGPMGLLGHYRKLHLFDSEKNVFEPGDLGLGVFDTPVGKIGLCVCYDLRFVEVARALALQGAQIIAVPTAWVGGFDRSPRDAMGYIGQARGAVVQANLNQVFIACASQSGSRDDIRFLGSSLIVDPFGTVLHGPMADDQAGIGLAEVDVADVERAQWRSELIRPRADRRTDVYKILIGGQAK